MGGLPRGGGTLGVALGLALLGSAGYALLLPRLLDAWGRFFEWSRSIAGLPLMLSEQVLILPTGAALRVPELSAVTPQPTQNALITAGLAALLALVCSFLLPRRFTPVRSILRLLALVQASAVLFFAASVEPFPYRISDYLFGLLTTGMIAIGLVPAALALTLGPLDLAWWRKVLATLLVMGHFSVLTPLLILLHAGLILQGTAVLMPVLFVGLGVLPYPLVFLGVYGWAASGPSELLRRKIPAPVHSA